MYKKIGIILLICLVLFSFSAHKFYIAIYQLNFVPEKKRIEITSRIFVDDLNAALEKRFGQKTQIGELGESADDISKFKIYLAEQLKLKVNGTARSLVYVGKEMESNVVVAYFKIEEVSKIKSLFVENDALMELYPEQQNIIQSNINGKKQSLLLTVDNQSGVLK